MPSSWWSSPCSRRLGLLATDPPLLNRGDDLVGARLRCSSCSSPPSPVYRESSVSPRAATRPSPARRSRSRTPSSVVSEKVLVPQPHRVERLGRSGANDLVHL